jgi:glycosyltransferase involved in cell wall biosynthesis
MSVSIVIPVYNEEGVIEKVIRECYAQIITQIEGSEFIIVNDGSTDSTPQILLRMAQEFPYLKIINLKKNIGHGNALMIGFAQARNNFIFHIDGDDQFKIEDFWKLYRLIENNDIVLGWRMPRFDPLHRKIISLMARIIDVIIFGMEIKDINSPFKFIRTSVLKEVIEDIPVNPFAVSMLIVIAAKYKGYRVAEIPVTHFARITGKSKFLGIFYLCKGCFLSFRDILLLKRRLRANG